MGAWSGHNLVQGHMTKTWWLWPSKTIPSAFLSKINVNHDNTWEQLLS